ncbi:hypothetical protein PQI23_12305 [Leucobacter sp. USCH14]
MPPDQIAGGGATAVALALTAATCLFAAWKLGHIDALLVWLGMKEK